MMGIGSVLMSGARLEKKTQFFKLYLIRLDINIRLDSHRGSHVASVAKVTWCVVRVIIGL